MDNLTKKCEGEIKDVCIYKSVAQKLVKTDRASRELLRDECYICNGYHIECEDYFPKPKEIGE